MMTRLFSLLLLFPVLFTLHAQDHVYDDLLILYVDEEYEKCIKKAKRYIENGDTRKDPLPYLYASKCYHEMSKLEKYTSQQEYKKADREALKYAVRFRKKDKHLEYFHAHEDHWRELDQYAMEAGMNWLEQKEFSKARAIFDRMTGYDPMNPGAWQMLAVVQTEMRMTKDAEESMQRFHEALKAAGEKDPGLATMSEERFDLLKSSLIVHSEQLAGNGLQDSARAVIALGADHFADDPEFNLIYEELN